MLRTKHIKGPIVWKLSCEDRVWECSVVIYIFLFPSPSHSATTKKWFDCVAYFTLDKEVWDCVIPVDLSSFSHASMLPPHTQHDSQTIYIIFSPNKVSQKMKKWRVNCTLNFVCVFARLSQTFTVCFLCIIKRWYNVNQYM